MNDLQIIKGVECFIDENGVAQLKLENVARGLGFTKTDKKDGKEYIRIHKPNLQRWLNSFGLIESENEELPIFIPEPIFYLLCMKAENDTAKAFQHTVAYEILPAIRRHGMYAVDQLLENPDLAIQAFTALKEEREKRKELEAKKNALQIQLDQSKEWYSIKRVAALNGMDWKAFDWRRLKKASLAAGLTVRKIFDANYGEVNVYHQSVWEKVYPRCEL